MMSLSQLSSARNYPIFFGTSGGGNSDSKGIYSTRLDSTTGRLEPAELAACIDSPGFLAQHPERPILYSSGRDPESQEAVAVAYHIERNEEKATLSLLNQLPTGCGHITHLTIHPSGKLMTTAHYGDSLIALFSLDSSGEILKRTQVIHLKESTGVIPDRQEKAHPHYATFDPSGKYLLVPDLGADAVHVYEVHLDSASLSHHDSVKSLPGTGPRHMKFSNDGKLAFVLNELSLTVDSCSWDKDSGTLTHLSSVASLPDELKQKELENTASEIRVHQNGKFIYTGNRGNDSIAVFELDPESGRLTPLQLESARAAWPRNFHIDPSGQWLVCGGQDSSNVGVFSINQENGLITYQPQSSIPVPAPICVHFIDD